MSTLVVLHLAVTVVLLGLVTLVVAVQFAAKAVRRHREVAAPAPAGTSLHVAEPVAAA